MANFDMVPPDANELFGFNGTPNPKPSVVNWKVISIVLITFTLGVLIGSKISNKKRSFTTKK